MTAAELLTTKKRNIHAKKTKKETHEIHDIRNITQGKTGT